MVSFKVVATKEKNGIMFTAVPGAWESNGILKWPQHANISFSQREKMRSDASSVPEEDWNDYDCVVKISGVESFQEALDLEKMLSKCIDSDVEESEFLKYTSKKRTRENDVDVVPDRNKMFYEGGERPQFHLSEENNSMTISTEQVESNNIIANIQSNDPVVIVPAAAMNDLRESIYVIQADVHFLKKEIVKMNVHLSNIYNRMKTQDTDSYKKSQKEDEELLLSLQELPLTTCDAIDAFNAKVKEDQAFKAKMVKELSLIGGVSGEENGTKISYKLIDHMFSKEVLTNYTWTGICKEKHIKKKPFNALQGIVDIIFRIIKLADSHWNFTKTEFFIKDHVLKQAKKRHSRYMDKLLKIQQSQSEEVKFEATSTGEASHDGNSNHAEH